MNYRDLEDSGEKQAVYFILDESRNETSAKRSKLMFGIAALVEKGSCRSELTNLANEILDCEQDFQNLLGILREKNAKAISRNPALEYFLDRLEVCPLELKLEISGNYMSVGLTLGDEEATHQTWVTISDRIEAFSHRFELLLFRLRIRHWEISNAEALALETAEARKSNVHRPAA